MLSVEKIWFTENKIFAEFNNSCTVGIPISWYPNLSKGNPEQLENYEIWGDNRYIHWPDLDEDISAEGLLSLSIHGLPESFLPQVS